MDTDDGNQRVQARRQRIGQTVSRICKRALELGPFFLCILGLLVTLLARLVFWLFDV